MALHNPGGNTKPIFKYDAKLGIGKIDNDQVPLKNFKGVLDMDTFEVGWSHFGENTAPIFHMVSQSDISAGRAEPPKRPEAYDSEGKPTFKWGFRVNLKLSKELAGSSPSVREFASNSYVTFNGMDALHDEWSAEKDKHPGKLPVVVGKTPVPVPGAFGKIHQPVFSIVGWIDPPEDLIAARNGKDVATSPKTDYEPEAIEPVQFDDDGSDFS